MVFLGTGSSGFVPFGAEPAAFFGFGPLGLPPEFLGFCFGGSGPVGSVLGWLCGFGICAGWLRSIPGLFYQISWLFS